MKTSAAILLAVLAIRPAVAADAPGVKKKNMKMDEEMSGKMMKPGMKKRDVKQEAEKEAREMKPKLERDEKSMRERK